MAWTVLISVLAILQLLFFGILVSSARRRYDINAPAVSGHEMFERHFRIHQNTLELMVMFLPALWLASLYARPLWTSILGAIYLIGRLLYWRGYIADPARRGPGFGLSMLPVLILAVIALVGAIRGLLGH
jgi:uncharacterized membrane protein YecN with MAPEG domain